MLNLHKDTHTHPCNDFTRLSWQTADIQMDVSGCWHSSVQCSPAKLLPDYSIPYHSPAPTEPSNLKLMDCLAMPTPYPHMLTQQGPYCHTTPVYATTHTHTSRRSIMHPQCLTCQHNMMLHTDAHVPLYTHSTLTWHTCIQTLNTCTHTKHEHMLVQTHTNTHNTHKHTLITHAHTQLLELSHQTTHYGTDKHS